MDDKKIYLWQIMYVIADAVTKEINDLFPLSLNLCVWIEQKLRINDINTGKRDGPIRDGKALEKYQCQGCEP